MSTDDAILSAAYDHLDAMTAALSFLNEISDTEWEPVCGAQSREEFAALAVDNGEDIEVAWIDAVCAAEGL